MSPPRARFVDLRFDVGATATIFVEYLQELASLDADVEEDRRIATALMHGLATDTDDFMLARAADFRAAGQIAEVCDRDMLEDLSRRLIAPTAMDVIARALQALVVRRNFAMAGVGFVSESERDTIAQAADFLVRREDIDTCVVYGVVGDKYIEGSLRTHSPSVDPAVWLEQAFGADDKGRPYGGGRRDKGGFRIPIGFLGRVTDRPQLWQLVRARGADGAAAAVRRRADAGGHRSAGRPDLSRVNLTARTREGRPGCASPSSASRWPRSCSQPTGTTSSTQRSFAGPAFAASKGACRPGTAHRFPDLTSARVVAQGEGRPAGPRW